MFFGTNPLVGLPALRSMTTIAPPCQILLRGLVWLPVPGPVEQQSKHQRNSARQKTYPLHYLWNAGAERCHYQQYRQDVPSAGLPVATLSAVKHLIARWIWFLLFSLRL